MSRSSAMAEQTSFSSLPTGSSPTRYSTWLRHRTRASCWSSYARATRLASCSILSSTRCYFPFQMCWLMFGQRRLFRSLLALLVSYSNCHQGQSINLTSQASLCWARHPNLISTEVGCSIPEPVEPFAKATPPMFIRSSEVIHLKCDLLHFHTFIHVQEVHDFTPPPPTTLMMMAGPSVASPVRSTPAMS
jgi:hypothetical protein